MRAEASRTGRDAGDDDPAAARSAMRELAARFPGSLRELDRLPHEILEERITQLEAVLSGEPAPRWADIISRYHGLVRIALRLKTAFRERPATRASVLAWLENEPRRAVDEPASEHVIKVFEQILRPPDGRLSRWVFTHIAKILGRPVAEVEQEAFPR